jgi:hypothetical protein
VSDRTPSKLPKRPPPKPVTHPGDDPVGFPRDWWLLPWGLWILVVPLLTAISVPLYADHVKAEERAERRRREAEQRREWERREAERRKLREAREAGQEAFEAGDYREAEAQLSLYLGRHPRDRQSRWTRGLSRLRLSDLEGADDDFSRLVRDDSSHANGFRSRGQVRALLGRTEEALSDYRRSYELSGSPYSAIWIAGLGGGTTQLRRFANGRRWIDEVARFGLGQISEEKLLEVAGRTPNLITRNEQLCEAWGYVGLFAERDGEQQKALDCYRKCVATGVESFIEYRWARIRLEQEEAKASPEQD